MKRKTVARSGRAPKRARSRRVQELRDARWQTLPGVIVLNIVRFLPTKKHSTIVSKGQRRLLEAAAKSEVPRLMKAVCEYMVNGDLWNTSYSNVTIMTKADLCDRDLQQTVWEDCGSDTWRRLVMQFVRDRKTYTMTGSKDDPGRVYNNWLTLNRKPYSFSAGRLGEKQLDGQIKWLKTMAVQPGWSWANLKEFLAACPCHASKQMKSRWRYQQFRNALRNNDTKALHLLQQMGGEIHPSTMTKNKDWPEIIETVICNGYVNVLPYIQKCIHNARQGSNYLEMACLARQLDMFKALLRLKTHHYFREYANVWHGTKLVADVLAKGYEDVFEVLIPNPSDREAERRKAHDRSMMELLQDDELFDAMIDNISRSIKDIEHANRKKI